MAARRHLRASGGANRPAPAPPRRRCACARWHATAARSGARPCSDMSPTSAPAPGTHDLLLVCPARRSTATGRAQLAPVAPRRELACPPRACICAVTSSCWPVPRASRCRSATHTLCPSPMTTPTHVCSAPPFCCSPLRSPPFDTADSSCAVTPVFAATDCCRGLQSVAGRRWAACAACAAIRLTDPLRLYCGACYPSSS